MTRNLFVRLITGVVMFPLVLVALFLGGAAFTVLVMIVMLVGALELNLIVTHKQIRVSTLISLMIVTAVGLMRPIFGENNVVVFGIALVGMGILFALAYFQAEPPHGLRDACVTVIGTAYLALAAYFSLYLRDLPAGIILWLLLFFGTSGMDTFSYVGGRLFGKHRLAPTISPSKTVEGAVIGGICAIIFAVALLVSTHTFLPITLIIALSTPVADVAGDLLESWVKRLYGVKDSYISWLNIFPGHGGVLDRIDGLSLVILTSVMILTNAGL